MHSNPLYRSYLKNIYVDSLVHDIDTLKFMMKKIGVDRIMLGSDYPFPLGEHHPGKMIEEDEELTDEEKTKMLSGNACKFFNMDAAFYQPS
jgi:aminocarboxymuconate-semialdehyde decarboxylase